MDYKDLKKLNKNELIDIIEEQEKELNRLEKRLGCEDSDIPGSGEEMLGSREQRRQARSSFVGKVVSILLTVAAATVLISNWVTPVMRVSGTSMEPIIHSGDLLIAFRNESAIQRGDIIAFYYNNKILLKRAIGFEGDKISVDVEGNVFVNGELLDEPYVMGKSLGESDVDYPVNVGADTVFVLGDHRSVSVDSRSKDIGNIKSDRIVGKIVFRVYPFDKFGFVNHNKA